jgi:hypothetical protein
MARAKPTILVVEGQAGFDWRRSMNDVRSKVTPETKLDILAEYLETGNMAEAGRRYGVDRKTIQQWKERAKWWPFALHYLKQCKNEATDGRLTALFDDSITVLEDRIKNGDIHFVFDKETGKQEIKRVPIKAQTAAQILATVADKRNLLRKEGVQVEEATTSTDQALERILDTFQKVANNGNKPETIDSYADFTELKEAEREASSTQGNGKVHLSIPKPEDFT